MCIHRGFLEPEVHVAFQAHQLFRSGIKLLSFYFSVSEICLLVANVIVLDIWWIIFRERLELQDSVDHRAHM